MIRKLRIKFVCINMAIVTAMLGIIFLLLLVFVGFTAEEQGRKAIAQITETAIRPDRYPELPQEIRRSYFLVWLDEGGTVQTVDGSHFPESREQVLTEYIRTALESGKPAGVLPQYRLRYQTLPGPFGETVIFADISGEMAAMENLMRISAVIAVLSFGAFLGISILLARWAVRPVEEAWDRQRQFVADASHELKTPLTVIMTNAELLLSEHCDEQEKNSFAGSILSMSRQMRGLVESLLELARLDNGSSRMAFAEVNFSELVSEGLLPFEPVFFEQGRSLESGITEDLYIRGSDSHLRQVLDILLDNAAKYSLPGSCVLVELKRQGNACLLSVASTGEPIGKEDLQKIFQRFYRIDKARTASGSYGLGLSIAQSIVSEHQGKIWAASEDGRNTFFVQLPLFFRR